MYCCDCVVLWWCIVVMMYCCDDVLLWLCIVAIVFCCADVLLWWCIVAVMYCCDCVLLRLCIPLWCTQMGLNPWKIKWNQGHPGYWPPKCKNEIRGVQPHMLRKEKIISIISHPTEGFAKIKSRGSRNKIKKVPSQHPKCSRNKTEGFKVSICVCEIIWNLNKIYQILNPNISKPSF